MMFVVFVLGLVVGSFLAVLIDRIPRGENVVWKPSHCDFCKKRLRWFELFPVVSFLFQGGKCRRCKKRLSLQYPLIEIVTAIGFMFLYPQYLSIVIFSAAVVIFFIDRKHQFIPDGALLVILCALLVLAIPLAPAMRWNHSITAVFCAFGFFLLWAVTRGRGLGFGDVKLALLMGLMLGYPRIVVALYIAFLTGAATGVILIFMHHAKMKSRIAFGPFLIIGTIGAIFYGQQIIDFFIH